MTIELTPEERETLGQGPEAIERLLLDRRRLMRELEQAQAGAAVYRRELQLLLKMGLNAPARKGIIEDLLASENTGRPLIDSHRKLAEIVAEQHDAVKEEREAVARFLEYYARVAEGGAFSLGLKNRAAQIRRGEHVKDE